MISTSFSWRSVGRFVVLCACTGTALCGCSSSPPAFDAAAEATKIDQAIAKVKSDPKMTDAQKSKSIALLEAMKPTEPKIPAPAMK